MNNIKPIPPFKGWVIQNFPFIEADFDAITEYQLLCKVVEYLNKVIANENQLSESMNYVLNYFNNLDVQDEIDNKLDQMAESGELTEIIAQYLELAGLLCFNTKANLKAASNLTDGSFVKTFGTLTYNDGKGEFYKIRQLLNTDVVDDENILALSNYPTLIAEKMPDYKINQINNSITTINNTLTFMNSKKLVFIGDSYAAGYTPDGYVGTWCQTVCTNLGINYNDQLKGILGGTGFATDTDNFYTLLNGLTSDNNVTDVIIAGGYNDIGKTSANILTGISNCCTLARTKFPNAKIHIGFIGGSTNVASSSIKPVWETYVKGAKDNHVHYLSNVEVVLHDTDTITSDHTHPTLKGQTELGNYITEALLYGAADVVLPTIALNNRISMSVHNHDLLIQTKGGFDVNIASISATGAYFETIVTGLNTYINYNIATPVTGSITYTNGGLAYFEFLPLIFSFYKNTIQMALGKGSSNPASFETISAITWVNLCEANYKLEIMNA